MPDTPITGTADIYADTRPPLETSSTGVAWPAIFGGAFAAMSLALVLVMLGSGFGLAAVSPWPNSGASAGALTLVAAVWLIVTHWLASGLGGYIAGRLRTKWVGLHTHEVFFRDTANGFLTWAVASIVGAMFLASAASSVVSGTASVASGAVSGAASGLSQGAAQAAGSSANPMAYYVDTLFRTDRPAANASDQDLAAQATRIFTNGDVSPADRTWLAQLVANRTGISQADAEKRVDTAIAQVKAAATKARETADAARKAAAWFSIFTALSMLVGAFAACVGAALGGQQRDQHG